jgi:hypothetical protein
MNVAKEKHAVKRYEVAALIKALRMTHRAKIDRATRKDLRPLISGLLGRAISMRKLSWIKEIANEHLRRVIIGSDDRGWYIIKSREDFVSAYHTYESRRNDLSQKLSLLSGKYTAIFGGQLTLPLQDKQGKGIKFTFG